MANTNILQLPIAVSVTGDMWAPVQPLNGTTQRALLSDIAGTATGFLPITARVTGSQGINVSGGGIIANDPTISLDISAISLTSAMAVADTFAINSVGAGNLNRTVTFPDAMKALTGLPTLAFPSLTSDYLIINHGADGSTYKIAPASLGIAAGNMPAGGLTGQILTKASDANYDTTWTSGGFVDQNANVVFSGPASGAAAPPQFRALVGADLPFPTISSLGGVQSKAVIAHQFLTQIGTDGSVSSAQPAFSDISGTLGVSQGGTGLTSFTAGDLIYASGTTTLAKLADAAIGNVLLSGGVGVAPAWGKVDLTTAVSGSLPVGNGGTGQATLTAHGVLIGNGTSGISVTGAGTAAQVLTSNGAAADPTFQDATTALGQALTKVDDTNVTLTLGGAPTTALLSATSITAGWTGQLSVPRGGTGLAIVAQGDLLYGSALNTLSALTKSTTATRYLANTGVSNNPAWDQINLANGVTGTLPVANGGTGLTSGTSGGSLYWSNNSTLASTAALATNQLMLGGGAGQPFATLGSLGTSTTVLHGNASGAPTFGAVSLTADVSGNLPVSNGGTGANAFTSFGILFGNNTSAIQVTAAGTSGQVLGGNTSAAPTMRSMSAVLDDAFTTAQGSLLFRGASAWTSIAPGSAGSVLSTNGASADPTWITVSGVGTVTSVDASGGTTGFTFTGGPITGAGTLTLSGTLGTANGGTNLTSYTQGDILYASSSSVLSKLAKDTNATRYLSNTGTTNNPAWSQIDLTNGVTGTLPVTNGGTGCATLTNHGILVGAGTSAITQLAAAAAGTVLAGAGTGSDPAFTATPTLGVAGTTQGSLAFAGATSGTVTTTVQAAAGTYNFNLPVTAGAAGQALISAGGSSAPMTWAYPGAVPNGRLTLTSGVPVLTTTTSGSITIYYTPYNGNFIPIWNGTAFIPTVFTELLNITSNSSTGNAGPAAVTTNSNYDLFVWNNSGTLTLTRGPAWTSDTARGTGAGTTQISYQNGILVNTVAITNGPGAGLGTYVGSVRSNGSSTIDFILGASGAGGVAAFIGIWNNYNRAQTAGIVLDSNASWTYSTNTVRPSDNSTSMRVSFISGLSADFIHASFKQNYSNTTATATPSIGIGIDSTTTFSPLASEYQIPGASYLGNATALSITQLIGFHYLQALENGGGTATTTWYGATGLGGTRSNSGFLYSWTF